MFHCWLVTSHIAVSQILSQFLYPHDLSNWFDDFPIFLNEIATCACDVCDPIDPFPNLEKIFSSFTCCPWFHIIFPWFLASPPIPMPRPALKNFPQRPRVLPQRGRLIGWRPRVEGAGTGRSWADFMGFYWFYWEIMIGIGWEFMIGKWVSLNIRAARGITQVMVILRKYGD